MSPLLHAAAALLFLLTARCYFKGAFRAAIALGLCFAALESAITLGECPPVAAAILLFLLIVLPWGFFAVHLVDARYGLFLLPTIYSIPLLFVAGAIQWLLLAGTLLFA